MPPALSPILSLIHIFLYDERNTHLFESGHRQGDLEFRQAIAAYLHQSRGVLCTPEQIIVGAGVDYLLLLLSQILGPSTVFAMENPSYMQAWRILTHLNFNVIPCLLYTSRCV